MSTSEHDSSTVRRRVLYSGHVQGVGFRCTTRAVAGSLEVTGFVRNLPDGRVELVAEGTTIELDRLQSGVSGALGSNVTDVTVTESHATGEFASFSITF
ncbi:MAG: acylphosphatase [Planctomycetes bacterium]|nr:acylphosphatase [Planctomycetota bacterium]